MMNPADKLKLRDFLRQNLRDAGDPHAFADDDSLFISGRLDSLAMTRLVLFLEEQFELDFAAFTFEVELIDSVDAIEGLVEAEGARRP